MGEDAPHGLRRLELGVSGDMGVGVQRKARGVVPEHTADRFYVHAVLQGHRREGVPLRYNYDKPEKPRRIKGFEVFSLVFHPFPNRKITLK